MSDQLIILNVCRLTEYNQLSEKSFTSKHPPWILKAFFPVSNNLGLARKVENHIKKLKSKTFITNIIDRGSIDLIIQRYSVG